MPEARWYKRLRANPIFKPQEQTVIGLVFNFFRDLGIVTLIALQPNVLIPFRIGSPVNRHVHGDVHHLKIADGQTFAIMHVAKR